MHHNEFLKRIGIIPSSPFKGWHTKFSLESVPEVATASLPTPPRQRNSIHSFLSPRKQPESKEPLTLVSQPELQLSQTLEASIPKAVAVDEAANTKAEEDSLPTENATPVSIVSHTTTGTTDFPEPAVDNERIAQIQKLLAMSPGMPMAARKALENTIGRLQSQPKPTPGLVPTTPTSKLLRD
jgi:ATP-dependent exoDNAse (exonuclease V) beta subunit